MKPSAPKPAAIGALVALAVLLGVALLGGLLLPPGPDSGGWGGLWVNGARSTLFTAAWVMVVAGSVGMILGAITAFGPPVADALLCRALEIAGALPSLLLVIVLRAVGLHGIESVGAALAVLGGLETARTTRSDLRALACEEFSVATRALGSSEARLFLKHLAPHVVGGVAARSAFTAASVIGLDAAVTFLGLGTPGSGWGALLVHACEGKGVGPGVAGALSVAATVGALLVVADGIESRHQVGRHFV